jgi:hypothetical protein
VANRRDERYESECYHSASADLHLPVKKIRVAEVRAANGGFDKSSLGGGDASFGDHLRSAQLFALAELAVR